MKLLKLAWRNVLRHKRRSLITAAAVSVGLTAMITSNTLMNGMDKMTSANIIDYETGHLEIFARGYYREEGMFPLDTIIEDPRPLENAVRKIPGVRGVTPRVKFPARVSNGIDEYPIIGIGINIRTDPEVFRTKTAVIIGEYLKSIDDILIGTELAKTMNLEPGSMMTLITRDRNGTFNAYDFIVSGLIMTEHPLLDANAVIMDIEMARELTALGKGATEISVRIGDELRIEEMRKEINMATGADYETYTYKELYASIFEVSGFKRMIQLMVALVVIVISAVGIVNTMLMAIMERIPEIGTLKAMGFRNNVITRIFLYEGGIIGLFGSLIGVLFGLVFSIYMIVVGIDFSSVFDSADLNYPVKFLIRGDLDPVMLLAVFLFGILVSVLVTLWPLRYATRLQPFDALRHI